ncbi:MAG: hypothetical protein QUU85_08670, partial [Candidatus Eisenbacteria bacterium]|nr:hypothetical protein [Candidatus Eisenbacteria bacterium]
MAAKSTLEIGSLRMAATEPAVATRLAVALPYARVRYLSAVAGDEKAPHFAPQEEPLQDGRAYMSKEGLPLYRPSLRVAQRAGDLPGPDVRLLKDAQGKVWLQLILEESPPAGLPANAEPFNVKLESVQLRWKDTQGQAQQRDFAQPTLVATDDPQDPTHPNFEVRVAAELQPQEVEAIHQALSIPTSGAALRAVLSYGYWTDDPDPGPGPDRASGGGGGRTTWAGAHIRDHRRAGFLRACLLYTSP